MFAWNNFRIIAGEATGKNKSKIKFMKIILTTLGKPNLIVKNCTIHEYVERFAVQTLDINSSVTFVDTHKKVR